MPIVPVALKYKNLLGNGNLAKVIHRVSMEPKDLAVVRECPLDPSSVTWEETGGAPQGIFQKAAHKHRCYER